MEEEIEEDGPEIILVDGIPCIVLPPGSIMEEKPTRHDPVNHPFSFGWLQETKKRQSMPDIMKEIENIFNIPFMPVKWKVFKITEKGEIKEIKQEDEENDNAK